MSVFCLISPLSPSSLEQLTEFTITLLLPNPPVLSLPHALTLPPNPCASNQGICYFLQKYVFRAFDGQFIYLLCPADTCEVVDFRTDLDFAQSFDEVALESGLLIAANDAEREVSEIEAALDISAEAHADDSVVKVEVRAG